MTWAQLTLLLLQFGIRGFDLADKLIARWNDPTPVTPADIDELRKLGQRTPKDAIFEALARAGVPYDSEQAKALLATIP